jgi:ATP-dependent DNA helicase RecG
VAAQESPRHLARAWERIGEEVAAGRQAYVVCPRIGDGQSEEAETAADPAEPARRPSVAVVELAELLTDELLPGLRVAMLHGRLPTEVKDATMRAFAAGQVDVLVATTVIEVGVDVPNATMMVVMDADRFGVSQLHQIRGRVGRGTHPGLCLLVTEAFRDSPARERLAAVAATLDGFELSRLDLAQRREGDVLGANQSGVRSSLRLLEVLRHEDVIAEAREHAGRLVEEDPTLAGVPALAREVAALEDAARVEFLDKS